NADAPPCTAVGGPFVLAGFDFPDASFGRNELQMLLGGEDHLLDQIAFTVVLNVHEMHGGPGIRPQGPQCPVHGFGSESVAALEHQLRDLTWWERIFVLVRQDQIDDRTISTRILYGHTKRWSVQIEEGVVQEL